MKKITLENGTVVEISDESYEALAKGVKTKKPWRAKGREMYWYVSSPTIVHHVDDQRIADEYHYLTGNYYRTREEAEKALERQKAIGRVTHRIYELNDGWEPDWTNGNEKKYDIYLDYECGDFDRGYGCFCKRQTLPYMASEEIANQIISEMNDDLKIIWGL